MDQPNRSFTSSERRSILLQIASLSFVGAGVSLGTYAWRRYRRNNQSNQPSTQSVVPNSNVSLVADPSFDETDNQQPNNPSILQHDSVEQMNDAEDLFDVDPLTAPTQINQATDQTVSSNRSSRRRLSMSAAVSLLPVQSVNESSHHTHSDSLGSPLHPVIDQSFNQAVDEMIDAANEATAVLLDVPPHNQTSADSASQLNDHLTDSSVAQEADQTTTSDLSVDQHNHSVDHSDILVVDRPVSSSLMFETIMAVVLLLCSFLVTMDSRWLLLAVLLSSGMLVFNMPRVNRVLTKSFDHSDVVGSALNGIQMFLFSPRSVPSDPAPRPLPYPHRSQPLYPQNPPSPQPSNTPADPEINQHVLSLCSQPTSNEADSDDEKKVQSVDHTVKTPLVSSSTLHRSSKHVSFPPSEQDAHSSALFNRSTSQTIDEDEVKHFDATSPRLSNQTYRPPSLSRSFSHDSSLKGPSVSARRSAIKLSRSHDSINESFVPSPIASPSPTESSSDCSFRPEKFFAHPPLFDIGHSLGQPTVSTLTVKFTFPYSFEDVIAAYWDLTSDIPMPRASPRASSPTSSQSFNHGHDQSTDQPIAPPFIHPDVSDVKYELLHLHAEPGTGRVHAVRVLSVAVKVPTVIRRGLGGLQKRPPQAIEKLLLDPGARYMRIESFNEEATRFLLVHEARKLVVPTDNRHLCELHCRVRLHLLPSCGMLKATIAKWIGQVWQAKQQQMFYAIMNRVQQRQPRQTHSRARTVV